MLAALPTAAQRYLEALMARTNEYQSEFVRRFVFQGRVEGRAEATITAVLAVLDARGVAVPENIRTRITECSDASQLDIWVRRAATATSIGELFDDPQAIRACLPPALAADFDHEWEIVLDRVRHSRDLVDLREWLSKWRHIAHMEVCDPGSYRQMSAKADAIMRTGANVDSVPTADMQAIIQRRLGR